MLKFECLIVVVVLKLIVGIFSIGCMLVLLSVVFSIIGLVMLCMVRLLVILNLLLFSGLMWVFLKVIIGYLVVLKKLGFFRCLFSVLMWVLRLVSGRFILMLELVGLVLLYISVFLLMLRLVVGLENLKWF